MKNEKVYEKEIEDGSLIRYEINEDHNKELSTLSRIYKGFFNRDPKEFRYAKDIKYYLGGWPNENTPPRAKILADHIADAYLLLSFVGYDLDLNIYLRDRGLRIVPVNDDRDYHGEFLLEDIDWQLDKKRKKMVEDNWKALFDYDLPTEPKDILKALLDRACDKQATICALADQIKLDKGGKVEEECDVKASDYVRAVNYKYKITKGQDITESLEKLKDGMDRTKEALEILDK